MPSLSDASSINSQHKPRAEGPLYRGLGSNRTANRVRLFTPLNDGGADRGSAGLGVQLSGVGVHNSPRLCGLAECSCPVGRVQSEVLPGDDAGAYGGQHRFRLKTYPPPAGHGPVPPGHERSAGEL
jgi:hypothetical protein